MRGDLRMQLVHAMMRFKKVGMAFPPELDIRMGELFFMNSIAGNTSRSDKNVSVSDIHSSLYVTKPAVSQMLGSLEKKGYIRRETDKGDRRRIAVTLTPEGRRIQKQTQEYVDRRLETVISRFGEDNTRELVRLFTLLADISEDISRTAAQPGGEGDDQLV